LRVNRTPGSARTGGEQPPRVALVPGTTGDPSLVVAWTEKGIAGTRLVTARSSDAGRTFGAESVVPGSDAPGNRGWESIAADSVGRVDAVWLDHRDAAASGSGDMSHHMEHMTSAQMQADSVTRAQLSKLYFAAVGGSTPVPGRAIAAGVCYCCKTSITAGADGAIYAAWRQVYAGNVRDIAFTMSKDAGKTFAPPVRVSEDKWALDGCPENGPAIAVDSTHTVHLAWPTLVAAASGTGDLGLFYASSRDGRAFTARQPVPVLGTPRHVQIGASSDSSVVLVWDEGDANGRRIAMARGIAGAHGPVHFTREAVRGLGSASYPAVALVPNGLLIAASGSDGDSMIRLVTVRR
jgi:hypothetical protein